MRLIRTLLTLLVPGLLLSGCFTGVESTPKITYKDVKNNKVAETTPGQQFARELVSPRFSQWRTGKEFYVTSPRISLVLSADVPAAAMPVEGDTLVLTTSRDVPDLTGRQVVELVFSRKTAPHQMFVYRTNARRWRSPLPSTWILWQMPPPGLLDVNCLSVHRCGSMRMVNRYLEGSS